MAISISPRRSATLPQSRSGSDKGASTAPISPISFGEYSISAGIAVSGIGRLAAPVLARRRRCRRPEQQLVDAPRGAAEDGIGGVEPVAPFEVQRRPHLPGM